VYDAGVDVHTVDGPTSAHGLPVTYRTGDIVSPYVPFQEPLLLQDEHFVECLRTGNPSRTPGERGLDIVRVLAATDDARTGQGSTSLKDVGALVAPPGGAVPTGSSSTELAASPSIAS
jgi:hypothetical protein